MNIKHYLSAMAALAMLAACSDYDPGMSENAVDLTDAEIETIQEYTANFVERYGEMDPNHTWGFGELADMEEMGTRTVNVNRNQWDCAIKENNQIVGYTTWTNGEGRTMIVPGFPSKVEGDGLYYIEEAVSVGNNQYEQQVNGYTEEQLIQKGQDSYLPAGDVTDEEIQYVSEWFRTNQYPRSEVPKFTEFFIQDISQDYDRVDYPNGNAIDPNLQVYVNGKPDPNHPGFFTGGEADNGTDHLTYGMDYFAVKTSGADWEHENNFNKQKTNPINGTVPDNSTIFPNRSLKYWTSNGGYTTSFSNHNSDQSQNYENYVLVHLSFEGPRTGRHYDGYYLAFDYQYVKEHSSSVDSETGETTYKYSQRLPDGYYSNWIVKLAPADPEWYEEPDERVRTIKRRVMCEDLGSTFDFDFNDLVFDVEYTREEKKVDGNWVAKNSDGLWDATITLQAVGGTLPIYIKNFDGTEHNAHELMGGTLSENGTYSPVNVGTDATHAPVTLRTVRVKDELTDPDKIVILVTSPDKVERGADKVTTMILPSPSGRQSFGENLAPQKICMPVDVRWTKEYQQIEWAYPHFAEWVQNQNGAAGFGNESDWTRTDVDETKLYK